MATLTSAVFLTPFHQEYIIKEKRVSNFAIANLEGSCQVQGKSRIASYLRKGFHVAQLRINCPRPLMLCHPFHPREAEHELPTPDSKISKLQGIAFMLHVMVYIDTRIKSKDQERIKHAKIIHYQLSCKHEFQVRVHCKSSGILPITGLFETSVVLEEVQLAYSFFFFQVLPQCQVRRSRLYSTPLELLQCTQIQWKCNWNPQLSQQGAHSISQQTIECPLVGQACQEMRNHPSFA